MSPIVVVVAPVPLAHWAPFDERRAARHVSAPLPVDDKYTRGVLGMITGSDRYPGAAVLGVEAAARTGIGMVRYLGPARAADLVLARRPEAVTSEGRVQAWVLGSGTDPSDRGGSEAERLHAVLAGQEPVVLDAGALDLAARREAPTVLTPHAGELASLLATRGTRVQRGDIVADPVHWAERAARETGCTVLLKGHETHVCEIADDGSAHGFVVTAPTSWLATAGSGDVLAGVVGAVLALRVAAGRTEGGVAEAVASAAWIHGHAASLASAGGPLVALDIAEAVPRVVARLVQSDMP